MWGRSRGVYPTEGCTHGMYSYKLCMVLYKKNIALYFMRKEIKYIILCRLVEFYSHNDKPVAYQC
jgi:hypothetical protein